MAWPRALQVNHHEAKIHLFGCVDQLLESENVVIASAGRPHGAPGSRCSGSFPSTPVFLAKRARIDADLKAVFARTIEIMFSCEEISPCC